jgi:hypothetical protein
MDLPTFQDLFQIAQNEMLTRNRRLSLAEVQRTGSDLNIIVGAGAAGADEVVGQLARVAKSRSLATARGMELDLLVNDRYAGLLRKAASPSYTYARFSTTTPAAAAFTIPDGTILSAPDGLQFLTIGDTTFPAGSTGPVNVRARSLQAGSGQRALANSIDSIVTQITGAPADLAVTNPAATFGGDDAERDEDLIARARGFFVNARRGTTTAIQQAVLSVPGVQTCAVFESLDLLGRPVGPVQVVISDAYTDMFAYSGPPGSYQIQSDALANQIQQFLSEYRAAGITVQILVAQVALVSVQLSLSYLAGFDAEGVNTAAKTSIMSVVNNLPPGGNITLDLLQQALRVIPGLAYTGNEVLTPRNEVVAGGGQALRTNLSLIQVV